MSALLIASGMAFLHHIKTIITNLIKSYSELKEFETVAEQNL